ncbi:DMSO/selenate family reductase complex B subunit [Halarcobacter ebronensis]|uniref:Dimethylsulfoxide reductase, chain B n=1 Tax=Halarcobacter ebronensis TaxID=1462615 RepID=A0A4Q1AV45_9BACT|nr:DMSO/selenate family reductase complex B subunit [Halarcobacter ebronensis]QKF83259.1 anaerobic DMSO reductase DmsABC, chain B, iron-sulfur subunit [Halarcobacter ebronensis]RXK05823.1 dimethylsulfoxide reductase, chain B [Halarcobacter ebronensis]
MEKNRQFGFYLDQTRCVGCRTCQLACKDYKQSSIGISFRRVVEYEGGKWFQKQSGAFEQTNVFTYYTSLSCNHCDDPACTKACPTGAMHKDSYGIVSVDADKCIGCKSCAMACPYGAPQFDEESGHMTKCNGCSERLDEGLDPICVEACPFRALEAGPIKELREKHGHIAGVAPLPEYEKTRPNLCIKPEKNAQPSENGSGKAHLPQNYQEVTYDII